MEIVSLKSGLVPTISIGGGSVEARASPSHMSAAGRSAADKSPLRSLFSRVSFRISFDSLWPRGNTRYKGLALDDAVLAENAEGKEAVRDDGQLDGAERRSGNWVLKMLHVNSAWEGKQINEEEVAVGDQNQTNDDNEEEEEMCECDSGCMVDGDEEEVQFDRGSFSRMLRRVSLAEARLYAQMSHLGSLAYDIRNIKPGKLLRQYGMRFVTSSIEKKELAATAEKDPQKVETNEKEKEEEKKDPKHGEYNVRENASYNIAASAASYLHSRTRSIFPFKSSNAAEGSLEGSNESLDSVNMINTEVASLMATTDSMTAVVAAKEEVKQAVADDLNSVHSTPCEWFVCDDDQSGTRLFAIQGSETLASWQANLLFEPVKFEGLDVLVHRGIYEAAKGIYQQMLPEVHAHLKSRGSRATFRFTGHSLGGSLALLVNLMLLIRHEVPVSSLLPVITFGSPSIMCGGDSLLEKLGLPKSHVQAITMHRDIVPRAFSCNYPNHVAKLLKAVNGNFRSHPCLNKQKLLYAPMGYLLILQPDEKFSPGHHLLPSGSGLYVLSESNDAEKQLRAAQMVFLNTPHPLEILSDRSAYGSRGSIQRDHDMNSYVRSVRTVIRQELKQIRKAKKEQQQQRKVWWPLVLSRGIDAGILAGRSMISVNVGQRQSPFSGMVRTGRESLKRFSRLVTSQYMHLFLLLWFPARLLLLKL